MNNIQQDPNFVSLPDAVALIGQIRQTANPRTIRKFIVGLAMARNSFCGYAVRYDESYLRIDQTSSTKYVVSDDECRIPRDFWNMDMACSTNAQNCFAAGNLGTELEIQDCELPYRLRGGMYSDTFDQRVTLYQLATGIYLPRADLIEYVNDPEWQAWGSIRAAHKTGRPTAYQWDRIKADLAIEAARDATFFANGLRGVVAFINDGMRLLNRDNLPDQKEVYAYARLLSELWRVPPENDHAP